MATLGAIVVAIIACWVAMLPAALFTMLIGIPTAPGSFLTELGKKMRLDWLCGLGMHLAFLASFACVACWTMVVISIVRWYDLSVDTTFPRWPIWIAAWFIAHEPVWIMGKERPERRLAAHDVVGLVGLAQLILLVVATFFPTWVAGAFTWLPLSEYLVPGNGVSLNPLYFLAVVLFAPVLLILAVSAVMSPSRGVRFEKIDLSPRRTGNIKTFDEGHGLEDLYVDVSEIDDAVLKDAFGEDFDGAKMVDPSRLIAACNQVELRDIPASAIKLLLEKPHLAEDFDRKYGAGKANCVLSADDDRRFMPPGDR